MHLDECAIPFHSLGTTMQSRPSCAPLPLFDRFSGGPGESSGVRLSPVEALQYSLQLDLTRLFNARNMLTIAQFLSDAPTTLDYGLPDTRHLSAQSNTDLQRWELVIARAIALYEPRLCHVRVAVTADRAKPTAARMTIMALAAVDEQLTQFQFQTGSDERDVRVAHV